MPLRLKDVMLKHGISQSVIADGVLQTGGRPVSKTTISFILNYGYFPRGTPVDTIKGQIADFLRAHKVPEDEIAVCWEVSDEDQSKSRMPIGVHLRALEARSPKKAEPKQAQEIDFKPMEIEMLSPAAKRHFKLFRDPFVDDVAGPDDVFLSEDQRYVLEAMMQTARRPGHSRDLPAHAGQDEVVDRPDLPGNHPRHRGGFAEPLVARSAARSWLCSERAAESPCSLPATLVVASYLVCSAR